MQAKLSCLLRVRSIVGLYPGMNQNSIAAVTDASASGVGVESCDSCPSGTGWVKRKLLSIELSIDSDIIRHREG